jgi:D-alanyl-D-alanine carboxypeptidase
VTTQIRRWHRALNGAVAGAFCALLLMLSALSSAHAQPFASLIMDARTGEVLRSSNARARLHPASLTKMMTLYIAFEALENGEIEADTRVRISQHAASQPPSRLGLRAGQRIAFRYLIRAAALRSGNDAAMAIAEALEGSQAAFAQRMNRTARAIGMSRTNFLNPHGLTQEGHLSTASDMAILGRQLYFDYPEYYGIFSRESDSAGIATVRNTNRRLLRGYQGADGIKTGFTNAAGYNLAAMAERGGVRVLVIVMGARSSNHRYEQVTSLLDQGFGIAPRRAAIRRPSRPDYVRGVDDTGTGPAAGRVIRLRPAPDTSLFPRPRPNPDEAPAEALIAELRNEIDAVIADIQEPIAEDGLAAPPVETAETDTPEDAGPDADQVAALALVAPERSPLPLQRPLTETAEAQSPVELGSDAPETEAGLQATLSDAPTPEPRPDITDSPVQFEHGPEDLAEVRVEDGLIMIPGLPPILRTPEPAVEDPETVLAVVAQPVEGGDMSGPETRVTALEPDMTLQPAVPELVVGEDGRILWRDEELLGALRAEDPEDPVLAPAIVLTTADSDPTLEPPMPEIVTRAATGGGREWAVELGLYNSQFDAERMLLRVALSESGTLGTGVRRVGRRDGQFAAEVHNLSQDEAETACLRLVARNRPCTVILP